MRKFCYVETQIGKKIRAVEFLESAPRIWIILQLLFAFYLFVYFLWVFYPLSCVLGIYYVLIIICDL